MHDRDLTIRNAGQTRQILFSTFERKHDVANISSFRTSHAPSPSATRAKHATSTCELLYFPTYVSTLTNHAKDAAGCQRSDANRWTAGSGVTDGGQRCETSPRLAKCKNRIPTIYVLEFSGFQQVVVPFYVYWNIFRLFMVLLQPYTSRFTIVTQVAFCVLYGGPPTVAYRSFELSFPSWLQPGVMLLTVRYSHCISKPVKRQFTMTPNLQISVFCYDISAIHAF